MIYYVNDKKCLSATPTQTPARLCQFSSRRLGPFTPKKLLKPHHWLSPSPIPELILLFDPPLTLTIDKTPSIPGVLLLSKPKPPPTPRCGCRAMTGGVATRGRSANAEKDGGK